MKKSPQKHFADLRLELSELADTVGILSEFVHNILRDNLCEKAVHYMRARLLTPEQKQCQKDISTDCLAIYKRNQPNFYAKL